MTLTHRVYHALLEQVTRLSFLHYYILEQTDDWGALGKDQIQQSFSRLLCGVLPEEDLTYSHLTQFHRIASGEIKRLGIDTLSVEAAIQEYKTFQFNVDGVVYPLQHIPQLNAYLHSIQANYFIQGGYYGEDIELIMGSGERRVHGEYIIYTIHEELHHTPNTIIPMAAVIGQHEIFVRLCSLRTIYQQKWVPIATSFEFLSFMSGDTLSLNIKQKVIDLYTTESQSFVQRKDAFIQDLTNIVTHHELGHAITQHHLLPNDVAAFSESTMALGDNVITTLLEVLADLSPWYESICGPLQWMVDLSLVSQHHAECCFFMYLSDTYFYDTEDAYMYLYSDMITLILGSVIRSDNTVNFELLGRYVASDSQSLYTLCISLVSRYVTDFKSYIQSDIFCSDISRMAESLESARQYVKETFLLDENTYEFEVSMWSRVFEMMDELPKTRLKIHIDSYKMDCLRVLSDYLDVMLPSDSEEVYRTQLKMSLNSKMKALN